MLNPNPLYWKQMQNLNIVFIQRSEFINFIDCLVTLTFYCQIVYCELLEQMIWSFHWYLPIAAAILNPMNPAPGLVSWFHESGFGFRNRFQIWSYQTGPKISGSHNRDQLNSIFGNSISKWVAVTWPCGQTARTLCRDNGGDIPYCTAPNKARRLVFKQKHKNQHSNPRVVLMPTACHWRHRKLWPRQSRPSWKLWTGHTGSCDNDNLRHHVNSGFQCENLPSWCIPIRWQISCNNR